MAVAWTALASTTAQPVAGYRVLRDGVFGCQVVGAAATTCTVGGLANGTSYGFQVYAYYNTTNGALSAAVAATPRTVPGIPTSVTATPGFTQATITWTAPAANGAAISDYRVAVFDAAGNAPTGVTGATLRTTSSATTSYTFTGLTPQTSYTFAVAAQNVAGWGTASARSTAVTTDSTPPVPALGAAASGADVVVSWPQFADVTGYELARYNGPTATGDATVTTIAAGTTSVAAATISDLVTGATYTFTVRAVYGPVYGDVRSSWSPAASVTVAYVGTPPTIPLGAAATMTWTVTGLTATPQLDGDGTVTFTNVTRSGTTLTATASSNCGGVTGARAATLTTSTGVTATIPYTVTTVASPVDALACVRPLVLGNGESISYTHPTGATLTLDSGEPASQYGATTSLWFAHTNTTAAMQDVTLSLGGVSDTRWYRSTVATSPTFGQLTQFHAALGNSWQPTVMVVQPGETVYIRYFQPATITFSVAATNMQCAGCVFGNDNFAAAHQITATIGSPVSLFVPNGLAFTIEPGEPGGSAYGATTSNWLTYTNTTGSTVLLTETVTTNRSHNGRTTYLETGTGFTGLRWLAMTWADGGSYAVVVYPGDTIYLQRYDNWGFSYSVTEHGAATCTNCISSDNLADAHAVSLANGASTTVRVPVGQRPVTLEPGEAQCIYGSSNFNYDRSSWVAYSNTTGAAQTLTSASASTVSGENGSWCHRRWYTATGTPTFATLTLLAQTWATTGSMSVTVQPGQTVYLQHFGYYTMRLTAAAA